MKPPTFEQLSNQLLGPGSEYALMDAAACEVYKDPAFQAYHAEREKWASLRFDRTDAEAIFRCLMQLARHFAKKWGFTIKQWPEN